MAATSLLFVHGTGIRSTAYAQSLALVEEFAGRTFTHLRVQSCCWGERQGTIFNLGGASIPGREISATTASIGEDVVSAALWELLYRDPLYELRVLAIREAPPGVYVPGQSPGEQLRQRLGSVRPGLELAQALRQAGLEEFVDAACSRVVTSEPFAAMIQRAVPPLDPYRFAISRSVVAEAVLAAEEAAGEVVRPEPHLRDAIVKALGFELGVGEAGVADWATKHLVGFALRWGARRAVRERDALTDALQPFAGDIVRYQARGEAIRQFIREQIRAAGSGVVVLAHSLGGIAAVDLLISEHLPEVELLVTVGSQAPFLYEIDALRSLPFGETLPPHFPRWLNVFDRRDLLSYVGEGVFPGRVEDVEVDNKLGFPDAHSGYWTNPALWNAIASRIT